LNQFSDTFTPAFQGLPKNFTISSKTLEKCGYLGELARFVKAGLAKHVQKMN